MHVATLLYERDALQETTTSTTSTTTVMSQTVVPVKTSTLTPTTTTTKNSEDMNVPATKINLWTTNGNTSNSSVNNNTNKLDERKRKHIPSGDGDEEEEDCTTRLKQRVPKFNIVVKKLKPNIMKRFNSRKILRSTLVEDTEAPPLLDQDADDVEKSDDDDSEQDEDHDIVGNSKKQTCSNICVPNTSSIVSNKIKNHEHPVESDNEENHDLKQQTNNEKEDGNYALNYNENNEKTYIGDHIKGTDSEEDDDEDDVESKIKTIDISKFKHDYVEKLEKANKTGVDVADNDDDYDNNYVNVKANTTLSTTPVAKPLNPLATVLTKKQLPVSSHHPYTHDNDENKVLNHLTLPSNCLTHLISADQPNVDVDPIKETSPLSVQYAINENVPLARCETALILPTATSHLLPNICHNDDEGKESASVVEKEKKEQIDRNSKTNKQVSNAFDNDGDGDNEIETNETDPLSCTAEKCEDKVLQDSSANLNTDTSNNSSRLDNENCDEDVDGCDSKKSSCSTTDDNVTNNNKNVAIYNAAYENISARESDALYKAYGSDDALDNKSHADFDITHNRTELFNTTTSTTDGCATKKKPTTKIPNNTTNLTSTITTGDICTNDIDATTANTCKSYLEPEVRNKNQVISSQSSWIHDGDFKYGIDAAKTDDEEDDDEDDNAENLNAPNQEANLKNVDDEALCFKMDQIPKQEIVNTSNPQQQQQQDIDQFINPLQAHEQQFKSAHAEAEKTNEHNEDYRFLSQHVQQHQLRNVKSTLAANNVYSHLDMHQQYQHQTQHQQQRHEHQQEAHGYEEMLQQEHQHERQQQPHNFLLQQRQEHVQQELQHYTQEQLFQMHHHHQQQQHHHQQQQQEHNLHSLHHASLHNDMQTQLQLQHTLQHQQQQQHQDQQRQQQQQQHQDQQQQLHRHAEHTHLMSYLHHPVVEQNRLHSQHAGMQDLYQQQQQHQYQQHLQASALALATQQQPQQLSKHAAALSTKRPNQLTSIDDLMIDEFHEDPNSTYKLGLSPTTVKHENQDDGYETSAGDVLTPNSHSSSTHSVTPQHQIQHAVGLIPPTTKCEDQQKQQQQQQQPQQQQPQHQQLEVASTEGMIQQQQHLHQHANENLSGEMTAAVTNMNDRYNFMDDELATTANNNLRLMSPAAHEPRANVAPNYMGLSDGSNAGQSEDMFPPLQHGDTATTSHQQQQQHQQQQHQQCSEIGGHKNKYLTADTLAAVSEDLDHQQSLLDGRNSSLATGKPLQKRRGRKKKVVDNMPTNALPPGIHPNVNSNYPSANDESGGTAPGATVSGLLKGKERKKHDRFNGMSEEEVVKRTLPDHLCDNLDIIIVGINPGLFAAYKGHHYAGPGNHFWKCLYLSGLTQEQMSADEDYKLMKCGIGFTNMVQRATKGSADLTRKEIKEGSRLLLQKLQQFRPKIAVFNGKLIFEVFSGKKDFNFGRQPECVDGTDTYIWVMPSSSARCAQLPRAADKVPFYAALKKFRDYLNGLIPHIDDSECIFTEQKIKQCCEQDNLKSLAVSVNESAGLLFNSMRNTDTSNSRLTPQLTTGAACSPKSNSNMQVQQTKLQFGCPPDGGYMYGSDENLHGGGHVVDHEQVPGAGGPGPPTGSSVMPNKMSSSQHSGDNYIIQPFHGHGNGHGQLQQQPEKKKRGRPKKIKGQEIIDPATGNKIQLNAGNHVQQTTGNDFNNILNLSMMSASSAGETPKKKRGRPKKLKPTPDMIQTQNALQQQQQQQQLQQQPNAMSIQSLTSEHIASPQHRQQTLYGTPSPSLQQRLYASASPMRCSPALNSSYTPITPPISAQQSTPPMNQQQQQCESNKTMSSPSDIVTSLHQITGADSNNSYYAGKLMPSSALSGVSTSESDPIAAVGDGMVVGVNDMSTVDMSAASGDQHLCESPPPTSSPNICAVDFEPPAASTLSAEQQESELQHSRQMSALHQGMQLSQQQASRYSSPAHDATSSEQQQQQSQEHFQQWLSPQHQFNHHQQQQQQQQVTLHYQEQQLQHHLQLQHNQQQAHVSLQQQQQQQHQHPQWQRLQQRYEDARNHQHHYLLSSPHPHSQHHQLHQQHTHLAAAASEQQQQQHQHLQQNNHHAAQLSADVASKSLSGLESLVDQIPTISESESAAAISATAAANAAATAALESRLQGLQNQRLLAANAAADVQQQQHSESFGAAAASGTPPNATADTLRSGGVGGGGTSSGSNTPHTVNSLYGESSPSNYSVHRLNSTTSAASSPVLMSPHHQQQHHHHQLHQQQQQQRVQQRNHQQQQFGAEDATASSLMIEEMLPLSVTPATALSEAHLHSPTTDSAAEQQPARSTPPVVAATAVAASTASMYTSNQPTSQNIHNSNFSVSNLAASSHSMPSNNVNSNGNSNNTSSCNDNYTSQSAAAATPPPSASNAYHSNLIAAAALAAAAVNSPTSLGGGSPHAVAAHHVTHPQMYMDPHAHMPHVPVVNSMYPPPPHSHHPVHHHHHHPAYGHVANVAASEYGSAYAAAAAVHTLHVPSANYPYGYGTSPTQNNYATAALHAAHQSTPPPPAPPPPAGAVSAAAAAAAAAAAVAGYHPHHPHHGHGHGHPHAHHGHATHHHLSIFERLKPSDIGGYGGGF